METLTLRVNPITLIIRQYFLKYPLNNRHLAILMMAMKIVTIVVGIKGKVPLCPVSPLIH